MSPTTGTDIGAGNSAGKDFTLQNDLDSWVFASSEGADIDLYCLPPAGAGAATYRTWPEVLPRHIGVHRIQPPGRENRYREPCCENITDYVAAVCGLIERTPDRPFALFGHSMGAMIAYEVAIRLRQRTGRQPEHLFVSAFISPRTPRPEPIHELPDEEFLRQLRIRYDGIPEELLQYPEVLELMLPIVRADLALISTYDYRPNAPLTCPITVLGGRSDPWINEDQLEDWQHVTTVPLSRHLLPGGHFYLNSASSEVLRIIDQTLRQ
ncbi:alpha/beta fold hydrolase [Methylonatrum kenyense]|uniref:thioesterase II family protein n=1 Tax=Methylonatrum kenyense TaxID=455253 RepID=UPI0020BF7ABC|nr:alpha/beta fold hydrolase [Methylonatrum kenyense]MCK8516791.1 alpha/beta fold hydrolase [Methylonatrum kenyense]